MKAQIKLTDVLGLLQKGKTRAEIAAHYGISMTDCGKLFQHPELKGKKAIKQPQFELIDDLSGDVVEETISEEDIVSEEVQETIVEEDIQESPTEPEEAAEEESTPVGGSEAAHNWNN